MRHQPHSFYLQEATLPIEAGGNQPSQQAAKAMSAKESK